MPLKSYVVSIQAMLLLSLEVHCLPVIQHLGQQAVKPNDNEQSASRETEPIRVEQMNVQMEPFRIPLEFTVSRQLYRGHHRLRKNADQLMPIELVIPLKSLVTHIAHRIDVDPSIHPVQTFNGPEKSFSRLRNDYYHSQVAAGDPIRARRTKRIARD